LPTINDVAKRAGVSVGTVSHVLNNMRHVTPATREKVERAIEELGYVPRVAARSLRSKQSHWLALIVPDITNAYWHAVVRGVEDAAQSRGYAVLLGNADDILTKQNQYVDVAVSQNVAGVIIAPCDSNAENLARLRNRNIPTVTINRRIDGWEVDGIYSDSISAARTLIQHLIELGHERIAMISGPKHLSTVQDRIAGYCIALAEAEIPLNPRLIKSGQFQAATGEHLAEEMLAEGLNPDAIFAANNTIAKGVISTLGKRELRIPQDIALVCFGDLEEAYFPFLTHILEPAYEMGMNAAQLLFSRLDAQVELRPRQVVLPSRLIIRQSCGSKGSTGPSLVIPTDSQSRSVLVQPLTADEWDNFSECIVEVMADRAAVRDVRLSSDYEKPDVTRLLKVLQHQETDRLPHLEFRVTSKAIYEYVLERELEYGLAASPLGEQSIKPGDQIEFARRLGMDAVACNFVWRPDNAFQQTTEGSKRYVGGSVKSWADLDHLLPPPSLADQLSLLERYLKAAQGTGVGVVVSFTSFFGSSLFAIGIADALNSIQHNRRFVETLMDTLLVQQEKVLRAVCDRFADELAFVVINDRIAQDSGLIIPSDIFDDIFTDRMKNLITHAKEHRKLVSLHTTGAIEEALPILFDIGFDAVQPVDTEVNDIFELKQSWGGKMALVGGFPTNQLIHGSRDEIEAKVREFCVRLAPGGGYVLGCSTHIDEEVPPENFLTMTKAVHKYGRYQSLGT